MDGEGKMLPALFSGKEIFGGGSEETFSFRRFPRSRDLYSPTCVTLVPKSKSMNN